MALIVQKYGGSSVADIDRIKAVRDRVRRTVALGHQVVVVVSAMGKTTDGLVKLAQGVLHNVHDNTHDPNHEAAQNGVNQSFTAAELSARDREMDLLLSTGEQTSVALLSLALQAVGQPAIGLTGHQVRVVTEANHTRARILYIEAETIRHNLAAGKVVVVTGFQGVAMDSATWQPSREITTLGRGGSDTSAVAIAAALEADLCEIYTDVPGILTTDPRIVPNAKLLDEVTCDEMLELASLGAKVLHPRSVEIARNFGVKMCVRSSWLDDPGTLVLSPRLCQGDRRALEVNRFVEATALDTDQVKIALLQVPDRPGIAAHLFQALADAGITVDLIIQSVQEPSDVNDIAFTLPHKDLAAAEAVIKTVDLGAKSVIIDANVAKVSIMGVGMIGRPGVAAQMFAAMADAGVNIQMISTSEIKISCVIAATDGGKAIHALSKSFGVAVADDAEALPQNPSHPVRGVALDQNRGRVAVRQIPDRPGMAAQIVKALADHNISVDMIVQSQSDQGFNEMAFTIAAADLSRAEILLQHLAQTIGCGDVVCDGAIAKVSIVGAGMIQASGVAATMFAALAASGINIEMIATSEIKVSCVVHQAQATAALQAVHNAFDLGGERTIEVAGVAPKAVS
ncbi:MAG: aspartate kinase [Pseudanabaenaceae cyanobacterium]